MDDSDLARSMAADLAEIDRTYMPYGKYGPKAYPPHGVPIHDLPADYLSWFATKAGFPKGRLGTLLKMVYQMKTDGSDFIFEPMRKRKGGRTNLRQQRHRTWEINNDD
jgi:uncharacterized protein